MIPDHIKAAQAAYEARPYAAVIRTSHFSATFRFDTLREAIDYLAQQYASAKVGVSMERYRAFCAYQSGLILPGDIKVSVREFIGPSLSSY